MNGGKAFQGALAGVIIGTALSLGVSTVKASFVAGVVAAFIALVPILGGIDVEDELGNEGDIPGVCFLPHLCRMPGCILQTPAASVHFKVDIDLCHSVESTCTARFGSSSYSLV